MRNTEARRREPRRWLTQLVCGWLLGLYLAAPAYAFTPSDSPLLGASAVAPNVLLLLDDSGSMNSIIYASGFAPTVSRTPAQQCNALFGLCFSGSAIVGDPILLSSLPQSGCSSGYYAFYKNSLTPLCLKLPDPVGGGNTRYSDNYISYLVSLANGNNRDFTDGSIPNDYRINVARNVATALITSNRGLRFGLATYNSPNTHGNSDGNHGNGVGSGIGNNNAGNGGYIVNDISDLTVVSGSVTQAQADANYNALISSVGALSAISNTPLAETYYEITRYFRGMTPYYNSGPATYTSPIQYRCQKNYGVVITDGLPTYDRSFPNDDPLGGTRLPNWDGINNDGNDLNGDDEGDTLYLDDIAKFAFDIDMRSTGTDLAGKSWSSPDFPKQNLNTYTVGFTTANQMLADAARYGQGKYYQATDSASLNTALSAALSDISTKAGSGGSGVASSNTLTSGSSYFQTGYDPKDWRGTIKAFGFTSSGAVDTTSVLWTTDTAIVPGATAPTYQSWNTTTNAAVTLAYGNFSSTQQTSLSQNLPTGISGSDLVEWSKGTNKTGLKTRAVLLGDIINSPLTLASPTDKTASDLAGSTSYSTFLTSKAANMNTSLVVNANDGFVNVINAGNGARLYGYMPSSVLSSLHFIADTAYINGTSHKFLNDGQVGVFDAQLNNAWKTLALGGVGAGGKTFYAVQLFDGTAGNVTNALWEISAPTTANTANAFNDLGYAYARPEVARLADGRWAAFISNGYGSNSGVAALYVVDIRDGSLIRKIVIDSTETTNGLSSVKLKVDSQSIVQAAYGGDLKGRMWKFDLSSSNPASWGVAFSGKPLFTAPGGATQPITAQPLLADHPINGKEVFFGTGKFNETADKLSKDQQAFYGVWDADGGSGQISVSSLQAQAVTGVFTGTAGGQFITTSQNPVTYPAQNGWYLPLVYNNALTGERVINQAALVLGRIVFTTASIDTTDPCSSFGNGKLVELDAFSGKMLNYAVLDTNGDGLVDTNDTISSGVIFTGGIPTLNAIVNSATRKIVNDSSGGITTLVEKSGGGSRRIMWRQIQ
ncbi:pilus assembly protein [Pseudomonas sp. FW306-02-F02-AA]|uniref:Pilus assembly protein n=1 Tax=Pseudomonas fluorescens TaxID=294 RepID=A0A0N9WD26_PSEFL|nr:MULTISPECIES: PilC/PilY family type IV pilus protein [Pseudomonas]ALI02179.1 pilus assembly protein [Pseudomonas fluorescens]PMZ01441.1 pilus assembly protein [Pseudomonas sp. FW306-02-F02-AB]PMZ07216.1 pilus assembly protein [Pseudomonas sp. FW306-02-H06C]PMZ14134.1 pilus assembly protein [Pseudomonas sp. FW306-02-F02-AA]PMZ20274.1 pilus assembly protein [Pseudomonas sp. FW306-02-F08-AA]